VKMDVADHSLILSPCLVVEVLPKMFQKVLVLARSEGADQERPVRAQVERFPDHVLAFADGGLPEVPLVRPRLAGVIDVRVLLRESARHNGRVSNGHLRLAGESRIN